MVSKQYYATTYDTETVLRLCRIADIDPGNAARVQDELENFAAIYRWRNTTADAKSSGKTVKRELDTLSKQAARLMGTLASLSPEAARAIERQVDADAQSGIMNTDRANDTPSLFFRLDELSPDVIGHSADLEFLRKLVSGLHHAASVAHDNGRNSRAGRKLEIGMLLWLSNIKSFWQANTDQPFSRDATPDGEPTTNAGEFCLLAFRAIEPDCPASRVLNGMKTVIKQSNKSTGKNRA